MKNLFGLEENNGEKKEKDEKYTSKVQSPIYTPRVGGVKSPFECFNHTKYKRLLYDIEKSNVSEDEKVFLRLAASRHIVFNYGNIADYYAIASKEMQKLMEDSALVIIDFDKSLETGFAVLNDKMRELYERERNEKDMGLR